MMDASFIVVRSNLFLTELVIIKCQFLVGFSKNSSYNIVSKLKQLRILTNFNVFLFVMKKLDLYEIEIEIEK